MCHDNLRVNMAKLSSAKTANEKRKYEAIIHSMSVRYKQRVEEIQ